MPPRHHKQQPAPTDQDQLLSLNAAALPPRGHPQCLRTSGEEEDQPVVDVAITVHDDGRVVLDGDDLNLTMWNHDPVRLRSGVDYCGRAVWKPRYHVLSVPGLFGYVFNLDALDERTECWPGPPKSAPLATVQRPGMNSASCPTPTPRSQTL